MNKKEAVEKIDIPEKKLREVGRIADKEGMKAYVVGGYVRDHFLNRPRHDFDITIIGDPVKFAKKVASHFNSRAVIYQKFRTALVPVGEDELEFVGTRKEEYLSNSRKPIVTEGTFEDDIRRRDFTINAMAASINESTMGEVVDIFDGMSDLEKGILRTPLDPVTTFEDDPLRMMRAARFSSQLKFKVHDECLNAISEMAERIEIISQERVTAEFLKILASPKPSLGMYILFRTGLLKRIFPEIDNLAGVDIVHEDSTEHAHKDVFRHTMKVLDNTAEMSDNVWLRFVALVHDIAKPQTKRFREGTGWTFHGHEELGARMMKRIFRQLKLPMDKLDYVEKLVRLHQRPMALVDEGVTDSAVRRLAVSAGDALEDLFTLCRADITTKNPARESKYLNNYDIVEKKVLEVQEKDKLREFQSPVRGEEIMEICGIEPSPAVGIIKSAIEEAILEGEIPNEYEPAKEYFLVHKDQWLKDIEEGKMKKIHYL